MPRVPSNTRVVEIPIGGSSSHYYTVEARRRVGYDSKLPGEGVIIHEVNGPAYVIDIDNNGNTGDDGATWKPGEIFADRINAIYMCINSETLSGYNVTVASGVMPQCATITPMVTATPTEPLACADKPAKPGLARPKEDALIRQGQASLKWHAAVCAETYIVVIREREAKIRVEKKGGLTMLEYQTKKLEPAHAYQWKVVAVNAYGRTNSKWREMTTK